MSPVVFEAVYERIPADRRAQAVRFGVRARLGGTKEPDRSETSPAHAPREALPAGPGAPPFALAYGPRGQVFPLPAFPPLSPHRGAHLDVFG